MQKRTAARNKLLFGWHNVDVFAVPLAEQKKYYASVGKTWREREPPYEWWVPTPPVISYYTGAVLEGGCVGVLALCIAETEVAVSTFVCFIRCAQFGPPGAFMSVWMWVLRHGQEMLLLLPVKMWGAIDRVGIFRLFQGCDIDGAKAVVLTAHGR